METHGGKYGRCHWYTIDHTKSSKHGKEYPVCKFVIVSEFTLTNLLRQALGASCRWASWYQVGLRYGFWVVEKHLISDFCAQKMVKGWTYIIAGFQMLQYFFGMRVFCLKYPFSHKKRFSGKKATDPRDLPILKWTMGRVKALAGSWTWTAAVGWRGGSLTRKRPVKIALRYVYIYNIYI